MAKYRSISKKEVVEIFSRYSNKSFEYNYIFNDCIPYYDTKRYWRYKPVILTGDNDEVLCICFWKVGTYKGLKYLDIKRIMTVKKHRKKGYGELLLNIVITLSKIDGAKYIRMFCNPESVKFYTRQGYKFHGETKKGYKFVFQSFDKREHTNIEKNLENKFINEQIKQNDGFIYGTPVTC